MKILKLILLVLLSCICLKAQVTSLDSLINDAITVSPKLKMLKAKYSAAESRINIDSNLPDPTLTLGLMNLPTNTFSFTQEPMTGKVVGLSQAVPFPGKLGAIQDVAMKDTEIIQQEVIDTKNEIIRDVSQNYYELIYIRKSIEIARQNLRLLKSIAEVVRTNYLLSKESQENLFKAELEITNLNDKIKELQSRENTITAKLNALLLRPQKNEILTDDLSAFKYYDFSQKELDSLALQNRPFLKGIFLAKKKTELQEKLAKYDYLPNLNFSIQYSQRESIDAANTSLTDFASFIIGISLPLNYGGKVSSKIQETEALQNMYAEQYNLALQMLNAALGTSISKLNSLKERIKLVEEIQLPQAHMTLSAALSSYQVAEIDFINVIDAQNKLYQIETNLYSLINDYLKETSELEFLTGTRFIDPKLLRRENEK